MKPLNERANEWILCGGVQFTSLNVHERQFCFQTKQRATATLESSQEKTQQSRHIILGTNKSAMSDDKFSRIFLPSGERKTMSDSRITKCGHDWENFTFFWKTFFIATQRRAVSEMTCIRRSQARAENDSNWHRRKLDSSTHSLMTRSLFNGTWR